MPPFVSKGRSEQVITIGIGTLNVHVITHSVIPYSDTLELLLSSTLHHSHKFLLTLQPDGSH